MKFEETDSVIEMKKSLEKLESRLNCWSVYTDLFLDEIDNNEFWKVQFLIDEKPKISDYNLNINKSPLRIFEVANVRLLLFITEKKATYDVEDYFNTYYRVIGEDNHNNKRVISQYLILKSHDLTVDNLNVNSVFDDIIQNDNWDGYLTIVNWFLLEVIKAYDSKQGKHEDLYNLAYKLSSWLLKQDNDDIFIMNYMQVVLRKHPLKKLQQKELIDIKNRNIENLEIKTGVDILLREYELANQSLSLMLEEEYNNFIEYPIYNIMKILKEQDQNVQK